MKQITRYLPTTHILLAGMSFTVLSSFFSAYAGPGEKDIDGATTTRAKLTTTTTAPQKLRTLQDMLNDAKKQKATFSIAQPEKLPAERKPVPKKQHQAPPKGIADLLKTWASKERPKAEETVHLPPKIFSPIAHHLPSLQTPRSNGGQTFLDALQSQKRIPGTKSAKNSVSSEDSHSENHSFIEIKTFREEDHQAKNKEQQRQVTTREILGDINMNEPHEKKTRGILKNKTSLRSSIESTGSNDSKDSKKAVSIGTPSKNEVREYDIPTGSKLKSLQHAKNQDKIAKKNKLFKKEQLQLKVTNDAQRKKDKENTPQIDTTQFDAFSNKTTQKKNNAPSSLTVKTIKIL